MITEADAIDRARKAVEAEGWVWVDPAYAMLRRAWFGGGGKWEIFSHASGRGAMARVVLDAVTGEVLEKGYVPR